MLPDEMSKKMRPKLIAIGNVLLDFSFATGENDDILKKFNLNEDDLGECSSDKLSRILRDAGNSCTFLKSQTGGSALNTMKMLSRLGEKSLLFCGMVGNDENAKIVRENLEECGLNTRLQVSKEVPTGTCVCLLKNEFRCCYANIGASGHFDTDLFLKIVPELLRPAEVLAAHHQIFYIEGFFVTRNRFSLCPRIYDLCKLDANILLASNLSATYMIEEYPSEIKYMAECSHILFGNLAEFRKLSESYKFKEIKELLTHLLKPPEDSENHSTKIIICTNGAGSVFYSSRGISSDGCFNKEFRFQPVSKEEVVDTTGCGDAFVAGFFYAYLKNHSIENCIQSGVNTASNKLRSIGGMI